MSEIIGPSFDPDGPSYEYRQSTTACCPRETIPDSCSCLDGCDCRCMDCDCWTVAFADEVLG